jgi:hypothetical protein
MSRATNEGTTLPRAQEMYAFTLACYNAGIERIDLHKKMMAQPPWDTGAHRHIRFLVLLIIGMIPSVCLWNPRRCLCRHCPQLAMHLLCLAHPVLL